MRRLAPSLLTLFATSALAAPVFAQDLPPPVEEGTDFDDSDAAGVELGEDIYEDDPEDAPAPVEDQAVDSGGAEYAPTYDDFRAELSPHGNWYDTPEYGSIWVPTGQRPGWRPYSHGTWTYTRHGWTFVSYDPWGAIPFHYGRWIYRSRLGWGWIPGYQWAPAWVSWRYGGGYVAWAPLGPDRVSSSYYNSPSLWLAVNGGDFGRPLRYRSFIPTPRVSVVFNRTREYRGQRHGPKTSYVTRVSRAPVRRVTVVSRARPWHRGGQRGGTVHVTKPRSTVVVKPRGNVVIKQRPVVRREDERSDDRRDNKRSVRVKRANERHDRRH